ncbi:hypothetical protein [Halobacillus karajensis]|uniref:DNA endonuclease I-HmuI-like NUMOD-like domain-containing protein n=1 Tax=Halobacillus karajensis TaxID=195088 RepID=A0A059NW84_9BACI|nr:hypothetical protein [Halobacillus karajensis]CDQ22558.1 hypothetical protein BN983_00771 [Halobacillus karajensis]CDQ26040.1 hypothetical protein BN981_00251 [Halobacillus karajensis]
MTRSKKVYKLFSNTDGKVALVYDFGKLNGRWFYSVKFLCSGYETKVESGNLQKGQFKDYGSPNVYRVGYSFKGAKKKYYKQYKTWSHMLERCYEPKTRYFKYYGGKGVVVCERWLRFSNFLEDIKELPNYEKYISSEKLREYSLDKDILGDGYIYSKESCMFANQKQQINVPGRVKPIYSISPSGEIMKHNSITQACEELGVHNANVYKVLNGSRKHTKGYRFERAN